MWLRVMLARLAGRTVERHRLEFKLTGGQGDAELALEDIATRHGVTLEGFKDD